MKIITNTKDCDLAKSNKIFIFYILLSYVNLISSNYCPQLNIGTEPDIDSSTNIINKGITNKYWIPGSSTPTITIQSKAIQNFYIASNLDLNLTSPMIHLNYDNTIFANTTFYLKKEGYGYIIEISYGCSIAGGALLTYTLDIMVPNCGNATFSWKKICGYPISPKDGLMVELNYSNTTMLVIRDGVRVNNTIWDRDVNNFALNLGLVEDATFRVYMKTYDDIQPINTMNTSYPYPMPTITRRDTSKLHPTTRVAIPEIDSDENIVEVKIYGPGKDGGIVSNISSLDIHLHFECRSTGISTIELIFPLEYFRDLVLFFLKECNVSQTKSNLLNNILLWGFIICIILFLNKIYKNFAVERKLLVDSIPYLSDIISKFQNNKFENLNDELEIETTEVNIWNKNSEYNKDFYSIQKITDFDSNTNYGSFEK